MKLAKVPLRDQLQRQPVLAVQPFERLGIARFGRVVDADKLRILDRSLLNRMPLLGIIVAVAHP